MRRISVFLVLLAFLTLAGCGESGPGGGTPGGGGSASGEGGRYEPPPFSDSVFHPEAALETGGVLVDSSEASLGYVAVSARSANRLKCQVTKGDTVYHYDLPSDGTPGIFPLQSGDGTYELKVMENVVDNKYAPLCTTSCEVTLQDEFQPFLRPSSYVNYGKDSKCVAKAAELAGESSGALDFVSAVYDYICDNVDYDSDKAAEVQTGYLPDPDETFSSGKGICFDYAALAAAMLRSQGVPVKVIFGYVSPDEIYHAWNMFYTEETGWVTVDYEVSGRDWNRLDLTFAANGSDAEFIGNGENYSDLYVY